MDPSAEVAEPDSGPPGSRAPDSRGPASGAPETGPAEHEPDPNAGPSGVTTREDVAASMQRANESMRVLEERSAEQRVAAEPEAGRDDSPEPERDR